MSQTDHITVPSGQVVAFQEMVWGAAGDGLTYRFRFIAPELDAIRLDPEASGRDMDHLCAEFALPRVANTGPRPNRIVISLSDTETEFGIANPEAIQIFESYSLVGEECIWEPF